MLPDDWFERDDVFRFILVLEKLGFDCAIREVAGKTVLVIWRGKDLYNA